MIIVSNCESSNQAEALTNLGKVRSVSSLQLHIYAKLQ
jgi:hypothetical protein